MKKIFKSIVIAIVMLSAVTANAHQPDISSFTLIEQPAGQWLLRLNASMTAFQYEVKNAYGEDSYASPEEFTQLLLNHLKAQIAIRFNGEDVTMENGMVKLGHATAVAFQLSGVPKVVDEVHVKNKGFENIQKSQVIFNIIKEGVDRDHFILNEVNDYQLNVSLLNNQILLSETPLNGNRTTLAVFIIMAGLLVFLIFKNTSGKRV